MSRNFEILERGAARPDAFRASAIPRQGERDTAGRHNRPGAAEEEITKLVQRLFIYPATPSPPAVIAFCGVDEGAGCSWVSVRSSEVLAANVPGRVCLVDANLRSPSLHTHFDTEIQTGFADAMRELAPVRDFTRATWRSHLWLMTAGTVGSEPNGALNPERLRARFSQLREEFDHVLVDTPPMNRYPDALLLGRLADGVVLVVDSNSTRRESARVAKENLESAKISILGAVLNRRTYPIPEALYRRL